MRLGLIFVAVFSLAACLPKHSATLNNVVSPSNSAIVKFAPIPETCDGERSLQAYCDGYWSRKSNQSNLPVYPENRSSSWPNMLAAKDGQDTMEKQAALLLISGDFDPQKPTAIFMHGWMGAAPKGTTLGFPDMWRDQAVAAGFNVMIFDWHKLSWDSTQNCPGLGFARGINTPCTASFNLFKKGGAADLFLSEYLASNFFPKSYLKEVRLVAHSLGATLAIYSAYRLNQNPQFNDLAKPSRIDLIDPAAAIGVGKNRSIAYSGQIPEDNLLPDDYRDNIAKNFVKNSDCHTSNSALKPTNMFSQYCQLEGMAYSLVKRNNLALLVLASSVAGITTHEFSRVSVYQAFASKAFKGDMDSRHNTPHVAYWFSFAPGEPSGGFDASSSSNQIREVCRKRISGEYARLIQTAGFDTINMQDDNYIEDLLK